MLSAQGHFLSALSVSNDDQQTAFPINLIKNTPEIDASQLRFCLHVDFDLHIHASFFILISTATLDHNWVSLLLMPACISSSLVVLTFIWVSFPFLLTNFDFLAGVLPQTKVFHFTFHVGM